MQLSSKPGKNFFSSLLIIMVVFVSVSFGVLNVQVLADTPTAATKSAQEFKNIVGQSGELDKLSNSLKPLDGGPQPINTFVVTNNNVSGAGSFLQAVADANASLGYDRISFNIPEGSSKVINLPAGVNGLCPNCSDTVVLITEAVEIDGFSQTGPATQNVEIRNGKFIVAKYTGADTTSTILETVSLLGFKFVDSEFSFIDVEYVNFYGNVLSYANNNHSFYLNKLNYVYVADNTFDLSGVATTDTRFFCENGVDACGYVWANELSGGFIFNNLFTGANVHRYGLAFFEPKFVDIINNTIVNTTSSTNTVDAIYLSFPNNTNINNNSIKLNSSNTFPDSYVGLRIFASISGTESFSANNNIHYNFFEYLNYQSAIYIDRLNSIVISGSKFNSIDTNYVIGGISIFGDQGTSRVTRNSMYGVGCCDFNSIEYFNPILSPVLVSAKNQGGILKITGLAPQASIVDFYFTDENFVPFGSSFADADIFNYVFSGQEGGVGDQNSNASASLLKPFTFEVPVSMFSYASPIGTDYGINIVATASSQITNSTAPLQTSSKFSSIPAPSLPYLDGFSYITSRFSNRLGYANSLTQSFASKYRNNRDTTVVQNNTLNLLSDLDTATGWTSQFQYPRGIADLNNDNQLDLYGFGNQGTWISTSNGDGTFKPTQNQYAGFDFLGGYFNQDFTPRYIVDLNNDNFKDILGFKTDKIEYTLNNKNTTPLNFGTFATEITAQKSGTTTPFTDFTIANGWTDMIKYPRFVQDINADNYPDIVGFGKDGVWVSLNDGSGKFNPAQKKLADFSTDKGWSDTSKYPRVLADIDFDNYPDIVGFGKDGVWVSINNRQGGFNPSQKKLSDFSTDKGWSNSNQYPRTLAKVNNDNFLDIVGFGKDGVWVSLNNQQGGFNPSQKLLNDFATDNGWASQYQYPRFVNDINNDGFADIVGFGQSGVWINYNFGK